MPSKPIKNVLRPDRAPNVTVVLAAGFLTSACAQSSVLETGSLNTGQPALSGTAESTAGEIAGLQTTNEVTAPRSKSGSVIQEARKLRQAGKRAQAMALLDKAANEMPDRALLVERGMLALELGQIAKANALLGRATEGDPADWRVHSALGAALSASGKQQEAQLAFAKALELAPDHPSILNNLALSYALEGNHQQAERLLRRAATRDSGQPMAKQNLALLLGLNGNVAEAKAVSAQVLPADKANANGDYFASLKRGSQKVSRADDTPAGEVKSAEAIVDSDRGGGTTVPQFAPVQN